MSKIVAYGLIVTGLSMAAKMLFGPHQSLADDTGWLIGGLIVACIGGIVLPGKKKSA